MGLPHLNSCCCGCTLKTGTMIIGIVDAVLSTIILITAISTSVILQDPNNVNTDLMENRETLYGMFVAYSVFSAIYLTMAIMLVVGASKDSPGCLTPWLIYVFVYIVVYIVGVIINSAAYLAAGYVTAASGMIISGILGVFLQVYFFLVVYSLYRNLKNPTAYPPIPTYPNFARGGNV